MDKGEGHLKSRAGKHGETQRAVRGHRAKRRCRRQHGMTLLEVVFAVALLTVIAASVAGLFGFVAAAQLRERQRLAAAEVAHRMILAYLDDPTEMPDSSLPLEYGPREAPARFRWEYAESRVHLLEAAGDQRESRRQGPLNPDRFRMVTVRVWLSEESGGTRYPGPGTPMAVISRMIDPIAIRNPDSAMNMFQNPRALERITQELMGSGFMSDLQPGLDGVEGGVPAAPRRQRLSPGGTGASDAFRRGASGMGGQRVPIHEMSGRRGSFNSLDFHSEDARR